MAMVTVFERLGHEVDFPAAQTCCGQPAFNAGYRDEARTVAESFVRAFDGTEIVDSSNFYAYDKDHLHPSRLGSQLLGEAVAEVIQNTED